MPNSLITILAIGLVVMWVPVLLQGIWKKVPVWKTVVIALFLLAVGTLGAYLMSWWEEGRWGGRSYYGAVFLVLIACVPFSRLLGIPFFKLTDLSAPAGSAMLALMRVKCYMDDCCSGRVIYRNAEGVATYFPNQLVELGVGLLLTVLLLTLSRKEKFRGTIYGWYLLLYGSARFVLNFFRWNLKPFLWIIPSGTLWSMVAVILGIIWLRYAAKKQKA